MLSINQSCKTKFMLKKYIFISLKTRTVEEEVDDDDDDDRTFVLHFTNNLPSESQYSPHVLLAIQKCFEPAYIYLNPHTVHVLRFIDR